MFQVLMTASVSFFISFLAIPVILRDAERKKLYNVPDERKLYGRPISALGGLGIFGGFLLASVMFIKVYLNPEFQYIYAATLLIFFLGLKNDLIALSINKKLMGQLIAAAILVHLAGMHIHNLYGLLGYGELNEVAGFIVSYLIIMLIMNAYNLIDGVDGLAASLGMISAVVFGSYFLAAGQQAYAIFSFAFAGSVLAFLVFNRHPAKIFMGHSGSLMIGLVNAVFVFKFIKVASAPSAFSLAIPSAIVIAFAVVALPILDLVRVFIIRIVNGRSPFTPDRNHLYDVLFKIGVGHNAITIICAAISVGFITLAWFGRTLGPNKLLVAILALGLLFLSVIQYFKVRYKRRKGGVSNMTATPTVLAMNQVDGSAGTPR